MLQMVRKTVFFIIKILLRTHVNLYDGSVVHYYNNDNNIIVYVYDETWRLG